MYFDELKIGMKVDTEPALIRKEKMIEFAKDYDNIPLHTDEEYAKTTPFGKLIAPGVMSFVSVWAKYLEVDFFGEELLAGKSTKIEWTNLVKRNERNGLVEVTMHICNQNNELVMTGVTEAIVKCRPAL